MKKLIASAVIVLALVSLGASNKIKVYVDYDRNVDFSQIKTFKWFDKFESNVDDSAPSMHRLIRALIMKKLVEGGLKRVEENPDVLVTYYTEENEDLRINTTNYMYHYGAGWWVNPYWGSGMDVSAYSQGTLVVDIWNPKTNEAVWRGVAIGVVPEDPMKAEKRIVKALDKLGDEWHKMQKKGK
jgi:hypothetical protein